MEGKNHACLGLIQHACADAVPDQCATAGQELEDTLEGTLVRAGSGVASAGDAHAAQPLAAQLVQFAEAQRIIVLDAVRTDFSQARHTSAASSSSTAPAMKGDSDVLAFVDSRRHAAQASYCTAGLQEQAVASCVSAGRSLHFACKIQKRVTMLPLHAWFEPAICRGTMLQGDPSSSGYESAGGQGLGRVAEETLASASHMSSADKHAAGRLIHLQSAYAVHDPETGYCQG